MEWKAFKDELPEIGKLIVYGNHRFIETALYNPDHPRIKNGKMNYKNVTHWCYIDPPPVVEWESEWVK
jgi:hypothetical protein